MVTNKGFDYLQDYRKLTTLFHHRNRGQEKILLTHFNPNITSIRNIFLKSKCLVKVKINVKSKTDINVVKEFCEVES